MQHAQPILLSHFLMAHAQAFPRDLVRLQNAAVSADACPMGSGALAGCAFAIDRNALARDLGFLPHHREQPRRRQRSRFRSRLSFRACRHRHTPFASCRRFRAVRLAGIFLRDSARRIFHRQQPDAAKEKSRFLGAAARQNRPHHQRAFRPVHHAKRAAHQLPARSCRKTRKRCFAAHDQINDMLAVATGAVSRTKFREDRLRAAASNPSLLATDAADYLVRRRRSFSPSARFCRPGFARSRKTGKVLGAPFYSRLRKISPQFGDDFLQSLSVEAAISSKAVPGRHR